MTAIVHKTAYTYESNGVKGEGYTDTQKTPWSQPFETVFQEKKNPRPAK